MLASPAAAAQSLMVFAASSLKESLDEALSQWQRLQTVRVRAVYASSSALARQIEHGAPAHVFISADRAWMEYLVQRGLVERGGISIVAGNRLVLIAPRGVEQRLEIAPGFALERALGGGRLALGNTTHVPAGRYAREALEHLGVWPLVRDRLAQADSVRGALNFVARRESRLGIVYRSDAHAEPRVRIVSMFPAHVHTPIEYPAAIRVGSKRPVEARSIIEFLRARQGQRILVAHGFGPIH
jgi:molybdate transport system substrate-binding protein